MTQQHRNLITGIVVIALAIGGVFYYKNLKNVLQGRSLKEPPQGPSLSNPVPEPAQVALPTPAATYKELITKGHEFYLKEKYMEALVYFKKAEKIEQNYSIYRSIYSAYLGLKDYANAEISIKKVVDLSRGIPNNRLENASCSLY